MNPDHDPSTVHAFPWANDEDKQYYWINKGMTLRDYFAAAALTGLLADTENNPSLDEASGSAYRFADAMLKERTK